MAVKNTFLMMLFLGFSTLAHASTEVYKGNSEIGDEETGKSCQLSLERDEKTNAVISMKLEAPAKLEKFEVSGNGEIVEVTPGKETQDLGQIKKFSEYRFHKQADLQGEGFMLRGEKIQKSKLEEKLFIHFDVREGALVGIEFAQREKSVHKGKSSSARVFIEKACAGLKKL